MQWSGIWQVLGDEIQPCRDQSDPRHIILCRGLAQTATSEIYRVGRVAPCSTNVGHDGEVHGQQGAHAGPQYLVWMDEYLLSVSPG